MAGKRKRPARTGRSQTNTNKGKRKRSADTEPVATDLLPHHTEMLLKESAISPDVVQERGYRSITDPQELKRLDFSKEQQRLVPGLLIPIYGVLGKRVSYQYRPDNPRYEESGDPRKYESLPNHPARLDVPRRVFKMLRKPGVPLYITEGAKKADSAVSNGLACIALAGVWNWRGTNPLTGGKAVLPDFDEIELNERELRVAFDSDVTAPRKRSVQQALERMTAVLRQRDGHVQLIYLPDAVDGTKQGLDDWFAAGGTEAGLLELATDQVKGLPRIVGKNRQLRDVSDEAVHALQIANEPPQMWRWARILARQKRDELGRPIIEPYVPDLMAWRLARVADFVTITAKGVEVAIDPPRPLVRDVLSRDDWPFPVLEGIIEAPALRPDGSIISVPGYDGATRQLYLPYELVVPKIPENPSATRIAKARDLLLELFVDFPFVDEASKANALGLLFTPVVRRAIVDPRTKVASQVPLALLDAPQIGTGKSLIARVVSIIATGRDAKMMPLPTEEQEVRKRITSSLMEDTSIIVFDNVNEPIASNSLALALTAETWSDRILGYSKNANIPVQVTWIATGNNLQLGGDLGRRCYWIRLDAEVSRPWEREGYLHDPLLPWVHRKRGSILSALLILARDWFEAGCPSADIPILGGYEAWSKTIGGVLEHAGIEGFLSNLPDMYEKMDPESGEWEAWLTQIRREHKGDWFRVKDLDEAMAVQRGPLYETLPDEFRGIVNPERFRERLGKAFKERMKRRYGPRGLYIDGGRDKHLGVRKWRVRVGRSGGSAGDGAGD